MSERSLIVFASQNPHKWLEVQRLLADFGGLELRSLADFPSQPETVEDGLTLRANAEKKASSMAQALRVQALADDSGLEVDALDGAPGVLSRRYAGCHASDADNNRKLLAALRDVPPERRTARFRCVLSLASATSYEVASFEGVCEGHIASAPCGMQGFGYDPLFVPLGWQQTLGELGAEIKDRVSHRSMALQALRRHLLASAG